MSLFLPISIICPNCEAIINIEAVGSVNADRRPDFRDEILANTFQETTCETCNETFRLQPEFNYLDVGRGQWIASMPSGRLLDYLQVENEITTLFDTSYGNLAPKAAQDVGVDLSPRVTFGWPAIREKLLAAQHKLDDTILEMCKLDILRRVPEAPLAPGTELRLVDVLDDQLVFLWIESDTEEVVHEMIVKRKLFEEIVNNLAGWAPIREKLTNGPFVDMQKLYLGPGRAAA